MCAPGLSLILSTPQSEGTRLQKDLRTYLASVKGEGRPGLGGSSVGHREGPSPPAELGRAAGCVGESVMEA